MADFTIITSGNANTFQEGTRATASITPAVGDVAFFFGQAYASDPDITLLGTDVTWTRIHKEIGISANLDVLAAFRATAGGGTAGVQTFTDGASDQWEDPCWSLVRPVDLTYVGVCGNGQVDVASASLTLALTTSSPGALLGFCGARTSDDTVFATDSGWTELEDVGSVTSSARQVQYRLSDDTELIFDYGYDAVMGGVCLEFDTAAASSGAGVNRGLVNGGTNAGVNAGLARRSMVKVNGIWQQTKEIIRPRVVVPGFSF